MIEQVVDYEELVGANGENIIVGKVTFKKDFGPWKKGHTTDALTLQLKEAKLVEWSSDGEIVKTCPVKLVPNEQYALEDKS